jgi:uncharacterized membrane protein
MFARPDAPSLTWYEPIVLPFILVFFGMLVLIGGQLAEHRNDKKMPAKYFGGALLVFAMIYGARYPFFLSDTIYRMTIEDYPKRWVIMHWIAFVMPLLAFALSAVWLWLDRRKEMIR